MKSMKKTIFLMTVFFVAAIGGSYVLFFKTTLLASVYLRRTSPNGALDLTVYQLPTIGMSFPGQGSDGPGRVIVSDAKMAGKKVYRGNIDIVNAIDTIVWRPEEILLGKMIRIELPPAYHDSDFYRDYYDAQKIARAAERGDTATIGRLLAGGARLDETVESRHNPVVRAARAGDLGMVGWLLKQGDYRRRLNASANGILTDQLVLDDTVMIAWLIENGLDPAVPNMHGITPIQAAIQVSNFAALRSLVNNGAPFDPADSATASQLRHADSAFVRKYRAFAETVDKSLGGID